MQVLLRRLFPLRPLTWQGTVSLMIVAWLLPFVVHALPWDGERPLGAHLLPACWAAFVAVYLYGVGGGLVVALSVPAVKLFAAGQPMFDHAGLLVLELAVFSGFAALALHRWPALRLTAPLAWVLAKGVIMLVVPVLGGAVAPATDFFLVALITALPGLAVLLALNAALVQLLPKDRDWDSV